MSIPFEPIVFGIKINPHLILEYLAFFLSFRYYLFLRKSRTDTISGRNRISIILGAAIGALIGSRLAGFIENPMINFTAENIVHLLSSKSIMGGLFGGLLGVEIAKKIIDEKQSSGDLFTLPIIVGIIIGRIGCFLSGTQEFTYGTPTTFFAGMDLGDGVRRHPTSLYEIAFLIVLFVFFQIIRRHTQKENGLQFRIFMITYFGFRFLIEFIKPNVFYIAGLSSIQWLCIICWTYYIRTINKLIINAYQKIYLLRLHY